MPLTEGQFGIDFADYFAAAERLATSGSPYAPEMLAGPVPAQGIDRYRYPPPLAQVLAPTIPLGLGVATLAWLALQLACITAGMVVAARALGSRPGREAVLWVAVATAWFLPVLDTLWKGNVSGIQLLLVSLLFAGAAAGGYGTAINAMLKLVPLALAPMVARHGPRGAIAVAIGLLVIGLTSILLSPTAWQDYVIVLGNLLAGAADYASNLAPDAVARTVFGLDDGAAQIVRWLSVGVGLAMVVAGIALAPRPGAWPLAASLGTIGLLLLPAALWYHYLVVLLPIAIVAWRRATVATRAALVGGGAAVTVGVAWLPLALTGGVVIGAASIWSVLPRTERAS
jgi:hypothetical protein